jgi:preprotein translocase subunit SecG
VCENCVEKLSIFFFKIDNFPQWRKKKKNFFLCFFSLSRMSWRCVALSAALLLELAKSQPMFIPPVPLATYSFDGQALNSTEVADLSGNGSLIILEGGAGLRDPSGCKFGQCFTTGQGSGSSARGNFPASLDFGPFGGSVAMWLFVFFVSDSDRIINKGKSGSSSNFQLAFHSIGGNETAQNGDPFVTWRFRVRAMVDDGSGPAQKEWVFTDNRAIPVRSTWQHVAVHLGPTNIKIYRDGSIAQRIQHSTNLTYVPDTSVPFALGNNAANVGFERKLVGRVDELRFFRNEQANQELSSTFVTDTLMIDPGTPAPTPVGLPPTTTTTAQPTTTTTASPTTTTTPSPTTTTTNPTTPPPTTTTTVSTTRSTTRTGPTTTPPRTTTTTPAPAPSSTSVDPADSSTTVGDTGTLSTEEVSGADLSSTTTNVTSSSDNSTAGFSSSNSDGSAIIATDEAPSAGLSDTLTIAIAVTGAVVVLLAIVLVLVMWRTRRARANEQENNSNDSGSGNGGTSMYQQESLRNLSNQAGNIYGVVPPAPSMIAARDGSASPTPSPPSSESNNYTSLRPKLQNGGGEAGDDDLHGSYLTLAAVSAPTAYGVARFV